MLIDEYLEKMAYADPSDITPRYADRINSKRIKKGLAPLSKRQLADRRNLDNSITASGATGAGIGAIGGSVIGPLGAVPGAVLGYAAGVLGSRMSHRKKWKELH